MGTLWTEISLEDVRFTECTLEGAIFALGKFKSVRFEQCNLRGASFEENKLSKVVFDHCDLSGAKMWGTQLAGVDLHTSQIDGLRIDPKDLQRAIIDREQAIQVVGLLGLVFYEEPLDPDRG
jgi:uncharacterized protein YjbI with pentapeptide repeats